MRRVTLSREEQAIERALLRGEYREAGPAMFEAIAQAIAHRKKDAVINVRVNSQDLRQLKRKAERLGVGYQTLLSELIHRVAA